MPTGIGYTPANEWTSATSSDAISAATVFVEPQFYPGADSLEVAFTEITKAAGDAAIVRLYYRGYDSAGEQQTIVWDETVANLSASSTSEFVGRSLYTNVPAGEWYVGLDVSSASTGFTGAALIRYVDASEQIAQ